MLKIYVMSKGELQEFKIPDNFCLINYHDFKAQNIQEVQDTSISKNTSILDLYKKNKILNIEANDLEINKINIKLAKKSQKKKNLYPIALFNEDHKKEIIEFIHNNKDMNFIFQCDYGRSRSLTTAMFAKKFILTEHELDVREEKIRNKSIFKKLMRYELFKK